MQGENSTHVGSSWQLDYTKISLFVICFLGVASHSLLLYAFYKDPLKCFKNSGTILVINLAVADFLKCLVSFFRFSVKVAVWNKILKTLVYVAKFGSTLTISSISFDRFLLVAYPIKHSYLIKGRRFIILPACIWLMSAVFPMKIAIFGKHSFDSPGINATTAIMFVFSAVMYALTYFKLKKQSRNMQALQSSIESRAQKIRVLKEKQFLRTIVVIACIAVITTVPASLLILFTDEILKEISLCILYINFAVNPLIYILRLPNYRKTFYLLYCRRL